MQFIENIPALLFRSRVLISDVHFGFEAKFKDKGYIIPSQSKTIIDSLVRLSNYSKKLIVLGDLKNNICVAERKEFFSMLDSLSSTFDSVTIVKGNHDSNIERYVKNYGNISVVKEYVLSKVLMIHGNRYASDESMKKARKIFMGHFHSSFVKKDNVGGKFVKKAWTFYTFDNEQYLKDKGVKTNINFVLSFPAFNPFFLGTNEKNGPYAKYLHLDKVFALDGVRLV